jgi:hypothetical protein
LTRKWPELLLRVARAVIDRLASRRLLLRSRAMGRKWVPEQSGSGGSFRLSRRASLQRDETIYDALHRAEHYGQEQTYWSVTDASPTDGPR